MTTASRPSKRDARVGSRAPLITESLPLLQAGAYAGVSQVARLALFAADPGPAVLIASPERAKLYQDAPIFGARLSFNPDIAEWPNLQKHVVMDIETAMAEFPSQPEAFRLELAVGQTYTRDEFLDRLEVLGYEREENLDANDLAKVEGYFKVIGDTLEMHLNLNGESQTVRAEFFGDELERLVVDGEKVRAFGLGPVGDFVPEVAWDSTRLERLAGRVYLDGPEFFDGHLNNKQVERLWPHLASREVIAFGPSKLNLETKAAPVDAIPFYRARLKMFGSDASAWLAEGYKIVAVLKHDRTAQYLEKNVLHGVPARWEWRAEGVKDAITFVKGVAEGGFIHYDSKTVVVTEDLLYGFQGGATLRSRKLKGPAVTDTMALAVGDYLIHAEHGIGQFMGLEARQILGVTRDYIQLKYSNDARIFLPVEQLPTLRRHPGTTDDPPRLSTLGTNDWGRAREKARKNAEELAQKLLVQYAARQATPGTSYPPILNDWDAAFETNFPFEFTRDQGRAIKDVLRDLEKATPMDRLVSGDVGFGKTEVAVRAAHRIVSHGRQVAILVPTTLLADQHLETFRKRFEGTPVIVAGLSRFTTAKEADAVFKNLKRGTIDIIIGTHRILSPELEFKDLGLLVIDEEHRFGVMQKERLKALKAGEMSLAAIKDIQLEHFQNRASDKQVDEKKPKARKNTVQNAISSSTSGTQKAASDIAANLEAVVGNVINKPKPKLELTKPENAIDVLSMSATPIPRSLYMSMVGLRDMSHIATPPAGRKPIRTVLTPFDPYSIRDAILFEMERGGKTFYIHDRIASIGRRAQYIQSLVPEARIAVAHGQMGDDAIEEIMMGFEEGAYDVLISTTIVESGLDIPEANTILIERADRLGLAQLYQLRGRVGRRAKEAFAFLFYPPRLTEAAERRLWAIADLTDLGSGHLLAEKDMEIRGVGNILGPEQHGHIQMVSLEVYTELLSEAIGKLKGETKTAPQRLAMDLGVNARLEPTYIPEEVERIEYYGRLSESGSLREISQVEREMKSRHGPVPREVQNFLDLARLRVVGTSKGAVSINETMTQINVVISRSTLDYDARRLKEIPHKVEVTKYPVGFKLEKKGLKPDEYARVLLEVLYCFA